MIAATLEELPSSVGPADVSAAEQHLVTAATHLPPRQLGVLGQRILAQLNPDGVLGSDEQHARRRSFALIPEADGSYRAAGRLTPTCGALLQSWLTPRSAPRPATGPAAEVHSDDAGQRPAEVADSRSHGQRMHDALEELAGLAVRRTELLDSGAPAQVMISMTVDQLESREGWAETSFGQLITVSQALKLADEAAISLLLRDVRGVVLRHGRTKRIATRGQTLALIARDRGCTFPECDKPPEWCQRHHIVAWADGGNTDLDNLASRYNIPCGRRIRTAATVTCNKRRCSRGQHNDSRPGEGLSRSIAIARFASDTDLGSRRQCPRFRRGGAPPVSRGGEESRGRKGSSLRRLGVGMA
ncbi:MAG: hypothetical protein QOE53_2427 [Pseudonocardiales bacterium]|nr:hypothetical protein [Pseudonocardiales bacterium]